MGRQWRIWTILKNAYVQQFLLYKILSRLCYEAACERSNIGVYILLLALTNFMVYISAKESNNIQIIFKYIYFQINIHRSMFKLFFDSLNFIIYMTSHDHPKYFVVSPSVCHHYNTLMMLAHLPAKVSTINRTSDSAT